jgi:hypothetical protein
MVRTVPTGRGHETAEVYPRACPDCGRRPMRPYYAGCSSPTQPGHRYWSCDGCDLRLIDADCDCDAPGRRWP